MALSNWDTLAVDLNGEPLAGFFVSPGGVKVEVYKNWIYIHDAKAWRETGSFSKDTVMEIQHGEIRYQDVEIRAVHGPQQGVYVACWHHGKDKHIGMIGCGVSGYDNGEWVGVKSESVEFLQNWISNKERMWEDEEVAGMVKHLNNPDINPKEWEQELRETYVFDFPEEIAGVKLTQGVRYNQGNMYFAEKVGMPLDATKPGEAGEPTMTELIDQMNSGL